MNSNLVTLVTAAISLAAISGASQCYLPDGHLAGDHGFNFEPCNGKNTTWQQCCFPGDICTRNGLCMYFGDTVGNTFSTRAGCVNANWSGCPQICLSFYPNSEILVKRCATGKYCCYTGDHSDCCDDGSAQYHLSDNSRAKTGVDTSGEVGGKTNRATIGAAVGGALGGLAMIGGAVGAWMYLRKKRNKQEEEVIAQDEISGPPEMKQVLERGADSVSGQKCTAEADMKDHPTAVEMDSTVVYELGA